MFPQNCQLNVSHNSISKFVQIETSGSKNYNIPISAIKYDGDSSECGVFYTLYNDGLTLVNNATYGFNVPSEGLKFNFPIIN